MAKDKKLEVRKIELIPMRSKVGWFWCPLYTGTRNKKIHTRVDSWFNTEYHSENRCIRIAEVALDSEGAVETF